MTAISLWYCPHHQVTSQEKSIAIQQKQKAKPKLYRKGEKLRQNREASTNAGG